MAEQDRIPVPHCPHCTAELPGIGLCSWSHATWMIFCVYCYAYDCQITFHN
jgi:hypothetical protein